MNSEDLEPETDAEETPEEPEHKLRYVMGLLFCLWCLGKIVVYLMSM